jgi:hypothetical protein
MNETRPTYILSNLTGNWAHFRPEDPNAPGYPMSSESQQKMMNAVGLREFDEYDRLSPEQKQVADGLKTLKLGFSGEWTRHFGQTENMVRVFAKGRDGNTALWLESKTLVPSKEFVVRPVQTSDGSFRAQTVDCLPEAVKIHAGCPLDQFIEKVKAACGDIWLNEEVRKVLIDSTDPFEELAKRVRLTKSETETMDELLECGSQLDKHQRMFRDPVSELCLRLGGRRLTRSQADKIIETVDARVRLPEWEVQCCLEIVNPEIEKAAVQFPGTGFSQEPTHRYCYGDGYTCFDPRVQEIVHEWEHAHFEDHRFRGGKGDAFWNLVHYLTAYTKSLGASTLDKAEAQPKLCSTDQQDHNQQPTEGDSDDNPVIPYPYSPIEPGVWQLIGSGAEENWAWHRISLFVRRYKIIEGILDLTIPDDHSDR